MPSNEIAGVWSLRSFHMENVETGERWEHFGSNPRGTLILHPGGRMVALITPGGRPAPGSKLDQAAAPGKLVAYSGRYRLEAPNRFVTTVDIAWVEAWVGTEQARTYTLAGDKLDIVSGPTRLPGAGRNDERLVGILSWRRED